MELFWYYQAYIWTNRALGSRAVQLFRIRHRAACLHANTIQLYRISSTGYLFQRQRRVYRPATPATSYLLARRDSVFIPAADVLCHHGTWLQYRLSSPAAGTSALLQV